ncbi:hypothetical protein ONZ45_g6864 [Pleurotus djamor]|nr:hypothetical protein ONZ45_g6864 [Pleurotus djamor]
MDRAGSIDSLFRLLFVKVMFIAAISRLKLSEDSISTRILALAAFLSIYDYLLTLGDEALLVWPSPWGVGKIFFFLTRYPALLDTVGLDYRLFAFSLPQQTCTILASISGVIMTVRVWAMWDRSKRLAIFLGVVIVIVVALSTVMFAKFASNYRYIDPSTATIPPMRGCHPEHGNNLSFVSFTALLGFELLMFALTIIKALPEREMFICIQYLEVGIEAATKCERMAGRTVIGWKGEKRPQVHASQHLLPA